MALTSWGAAECEVEGCGLRDVTFILGKMREEKKKKGRKERGRRWKGPWSDCLNHDRKMAACSLEKARCVCLCMHAEGSAACVGDRAHVRMHKDTNMCVSVSRHCELVSPSALHMCGCVRPPVLQRLWPRLQSLLCS